MFLQNKGISLLLAGQRRAYCQRCTCSFGDNLHLIPPVPGLPIFCQVEDQLPKTVNSGKENNQSINLNVNTKVFFPLRATYFVVCETRGLKICIKIDFKCVISNKTV